MNTLLLFKALLLFVSIFSSIRLGTHTIFVLAKQSGTIHWIEMMIVAGSWALYSMVP